MDAPVIWRKPWFERIYRIGIIIKGIDGFLEFVAGTAILISPRLVHMMLSMLASELGQHNARPFQFIAEYIGRVDTQLLHSGLVFLTLFLIIHGAVKLGLVYCLLKRIEKAYPAALVILCAFLVYQVYVLITDPSILMAFFTVLDVVIIWLVWTEYQELKTKAKNMIK
jgi:uncharacterized membrane protein